MRIRRTVIAMLMLCAAFATECRARLGETQEELVARFGLPQYSTKLTIYAEGAAWEIGTTCAFNQDGWGIHCDIIDGRCARITYSKTGSWTEAQIQATLGSNNGGARWTETTATGSASYHRTWVRADKGTADWTASGMGFSTPYYDIAKHRAETKAKIAASGKPPI